MATKKKRLGAQLDTDASSQASWIKDTGKKAPKGTYHYTGGQTREVAGRLAEGSRYPKKTPTGMQAKYRTSLAKRSANTTSAGSGYTTKIASKAYLKTARNGGEEGKENAQNRTGRIARNNTYRSFVESRTGKSRKLSTRGKRITSANKALLDRYNRGK